MRRDYIAGRQPLSQPDGVRIQLIRKENTEMKGTWQRFGRDEQGITALETAIILIAFVVVASVFAFTILSAGASSTQQAKEAIASGLAQVAGSLEVRGSVIATGEGVTPTEVSTVVFTLATVTGGNPADLTQPANNTLVIDYHDAVTRATDIAWTVAFMGANDGDVLLESRELAEITVDVSAFDLGTNSAFVIELKPPTGGTLPLERTTPATIDAIMDLN